MSVGIVNEMVVRKRQKAGISRLGVWRPDPGVTVRYEDANKVIVQFLNCDS